MPSTPSVTEAPLRDAVPKIINPVKSNSNSRRTAFHSRRPPFLPAWRPGSRPAVGRESAGTARQRAQGRIKPQRACGRHPREAISPDSRPPGRSDPTTSPGRIQQGSRVATSLGQPGPPSTSTYPPGPWPLRVLLHLRGAHRPLSRPRPVPLVPPRATRAEAGPRRGRFGGSQPSDDDASHGWVGPASCGLPQGPGSPRPSKPRR